MEPSQAAERKADVQAKQRRDAELCLALVGLPVEAAAQVVERHGYFVRSAVIGSNVWWTSDERADRVNLWLSDEGVVARANVE